MQNQDVYNLLKKYKAGTCTDREKALLESWYLQKDIDAINELTTEQFAEDLAIIGRGLPLHQGIRKPLWPRLAVAASVLLFLSFGAYFLWRINTVKQQTAQNIIHDFAPGTNKAILTLANGKIIVLGSVKSGLVAKQGISAINRSANGELVYRQADSDEAANAQLTYNSITIPRGAEYQVVILPDGTKVWVNSASSLRYPTAFTGAERKVELKGEAYFEVAHNPAKPFRVVSNKQTVEVLGTHFNINSYDDEPGIKTTLLKGSVRVKAYNDQKILMPGQQSNLENGGISIAAVDEDEVVAWKDGYFEFSNTGIPAAMRQVARLYNVDIQCSGPINNETVTGRISRSKNISEVLQMFQQFKNVNITIEGRRIMVKE